MYCVISATATATSSRSRWFEALALWKAAVFCEAIFWQASSAASSEARTRTRRSSRVAVPLLAQTALETLGK